MMGYSPYTYVVRGLEDIIPDADSDEFDELFELGTHMMSAYKNYAQLHDGFNVLMTEHDFSVPIWDYENNCILTAIDLREQSPNYGKKLEVHARGRMDAITEKPNGKIGIIDHKTSSRIDEDFFEKLETDEQCTSYMYAAEVEAKYYGLPYAGQAMEEVIYNVLRKAYPKPPTMVRGGLFSVDRQNESPTYEMLMAFIEENGIDIESLSEKHQGYISYIRDVGEEQFFIRKLVRRNRHQLQNAGYRMYLEALDMLDPGLRIYPNLRNDFQCLRCAFRAPCIAKEDGGDWEQMLRDNYIMAKDR
ncbi:MAG TPA: PD-(D/E)XK nuclease family protein [Candidatus Saccharimonadales bacterium]